MSYRQALSLLNRGRANPSDYKVQLPSKVLQYSPDDAYETDEYCSVFCRAVSIPGSQNEITALKGHENIGINRHVITGRNFGTPLVLTYTERSDLVIYTMLKRWLDSSIINSNQRSTYNRNLRINYYDSIKCDLSLYKFEPFRYDQDLTREAILENRNKKSGHTMTGVWQFKNCIPLGIEQAGLSLESADSFLDFTFSIAYESFEFTNLKPGYSNYEGVNQSEFDLFNSPALNLF